MADNSDQLNMGEVCGDLQRHRTGRYISSDGKVWHLEYLGEVQLQDPSSAAETQ
jgi:hypothetical protein